MRGFIEELRHRNVFRVGVAYVVTGWLIVHVADVAVKAVGSNFFRAKAALLGYLQSIIMACRFFFSSQT